jgi:hypothetical protein
MKFEVVFGAWHRCVEVRSKPIGLDGLDRIRETMGVPKLRADLVKGDTNSLYLGRVPVELTERQARRCGHLAQRNKVVVTVPNHALDPFVETRVEYDQDPETGEIKSARLEASVNTDAVVCDWLIEGAPLEWTPGVFGEAQEEK